MDLGDQQSVSAVPACKTTPEGRPGWQLLTDMLEHAGYFDRRCGQTWRPSKAGTTATEPVRVSWQSMITD